MSTDDASSTGPMFAEKGVESLDELKDPVTRKIADAAVHKDAAAIGPRSTRRWKRTEDFRTSFDTNSSGF